LRGSATEVDRFGKSIGSVIGSASRSAQTSLNGIFTPLQKIQRALDIASRSRLNLVTSEQVAQIQRAVSVTEGLNKPLTSARQQFSRLSADIQAEFLPALVSAQNKVIAVNNTLARTGEVSEQSFNRAGEAVDRTAQSLQRLEQLSRRNTIAGIGQSLEFRGAATATALARASAVGDSARQAPAFVRTSPQVQQNLSQLEAATERLILLQARYENRIAKGGTGTSIARQISAQAAEVERLAQGYQTLAVNIGQARFDEVTGQANRTLAAYTALGSVFQVTLRGLADGVQKTLNTFEQTGKGADKAAAAVSRFSEAVGAATGVESIQKLLEGSGRRGGFSRIAEQAQQAFQELSRLPEPIRNQLLPALQAAAQDAVSVGTAIADGSKNGRKEVTELRNRFEQLRDTIRDTTLASEGLFRQPRDVRRTGELNQSVSQINTQFRGLGATDRAIIQPFGDEVRKSLEALNNARLSNAPANDIRKLETEYRKAVKSLEDVIAALLQSKNAFDAATPSQRLFGRLEELSARYERLSESGRKAAREALANARALAIAAQDSAASPTARTDARQALDVAERDVLRSERLDEVSKIFEQPRKDVDALLAEARELETFFQGLSPKAQQSFKAAREELKRLAKDAADTGQRTEESALSKSIKRFRDEQAAFTQEQEKQRARFIPGDAEGEFGPVPASTQLPKDSARKRLLEDLKGEIDVVDRKVRALPESLRAQLGPEVNKLTNDFKTLARDGVGFTAEQAEKLAAKAREISSALDRRRDKGQGFLESFGGSGESGLNLGIDEKGLRGAGAEIDFLQNKLSQFSAEVRGPAVAALQRYREVNESVFRSGAQNTDEGRAAIANARAELVRLISTLDGVSAKQLENELKRVGDVARGVGSKFGLGFQQAVFAIDDFFSVTGGLDQRLRAAGNNISQLGFIIGGTGGLIAGVAASLGAQGVAALIKFSKAGTEAQDRTKALNDALARQKSLVEELAQAFGSLGDRLLRGVFSPAAEEARGLARQLEDIRKKQKELRDSNVIDLDPEVQQQRAIQGARQRQLEKEDDVGRRIALQNQILAARRAEQAAAQAAANAPPPTVQDVERGLRRTVFVDGQRGLSPANRRDLDRIQRDVAGAAGDPRQLVTLLTKAREEQERLALQNSFNQVRAQPARENVVALTRLIEALERQIGTGVDRAADNLLESLDRPAADLRSAQDRLRQAIEAGVPGAKTLLNSVDQIGAGLDSARQTLVDRLQQGLPLDQATVDAATKQRDAALANAEATKQEVAAINIARQALDRFAETLNRASQEAQADLQSAQQAADSARRDDLGFSTPATRQARAQADADLARQRELATNVEVEVASARERFGQRTREVQELRRRGELAAQAEAGSEEVARRGAAAGIDTAGRRTAEIAADARAQGNEELARFAEEVGKFNVRARAALGLNNENFWEGVRDAIDAYEAVVNDAASETERALARIAEIDAQLDSVGVVAPGQRDELVRERARLEQQAVESDGRARAAQDEAASERKRAESAVRGRDLSLTDGERAGEQLVRQLEDIRQFFGRQAEETTGLVDFEAQAAAQARITQDAFRAAAAALAGIADSVANAIASGPSRAALNVSDASTVEGQRELNRLLRGDDSARDQDLAELQRQTKVLEEIKAKLDPPGVAN
jgi:hypothetical protein